jgi:hypothetical protein
MPRGTGFSRRLHLQDCLGNLERFVFEVKKLPNGKKNLKTVKSNPQNWRKKAIAAKNVSLAPLRVFSWRRIGHHQHLSGAASLEYVAQDLCHIS